MGDDYLQKVDCLKSLAEVHNICRSPSLRIDYEEVIQEITITLEECRVGISKTMKVHIISDHLPEYFKKTGKTLLKINDEVVEAVHSKYKQFVERHLQIQ